MPLSIASHLSPSRSPYRPRGHPPHPLPQGLSDDTIIKLRRRAEKLVRHNNASFALVFAAKILAALAERGLANLSVKQVMTLAQQADEIPSAELAVACIAFLGSHPPGAADFAIMSEAIKRGSAFGPAGLVKLHAHIRDRERKRAAKRWAKQPEQPKPTNRPKLLTQKEKQQRADAERRQAEAEQREAAEEALEKLYPIRHRLKPWAVEFLECCEALRKSGFGMVPWQAEEMLELEREQAQAVA